MYISKSKDTLTPEQRHRCMSSIKAKSTKHEVKIGNALRERFIEFNAHDSSLPGKPDFVIPKYGAVIFVHGCFWHQHQCHLFRWPFTRQEFWKTKLTGNAKVDRRNERLLKEQGWWVLKIWECTLKGKKRIEFDRLMDRVEHWIRFEERNLSISRK